MEELLLVSMPDTCRPYEPTSGLLERFMHLHFAAAGGRRAIRS